MRVIITSILLVCYLFGSSGVLLAKHFCDGKLAAISLYKQVSCCCDDKTEEKKKDCCSDEVNYLKIKDDQQIKIEDKKFQKVDIKNSLDVAANSFCPSFYINNRKLFKSNNFIPLRSVKVLPMKRYIHFKSLKLGDC